MTFFVTWASGKNAPELKHFETIADVFNYAKAIGHSVIIEPNFADIYGYDFKDAENTPMLFVYDDYIE